MTYVADIFFLKQKISFSECVQIALEKLMNLENRRTFRFANRRYQIV